MPRVEMFYCSVVVDLIGFFWNCVKNLERNGLLKTTCFLVVLHPVGTPQLNIQTIEMAFDTCRCRPKRRESLAVPHRSRSQFQVASQSFMHQVEPSHFVFK